jgi:hypothetical protein
MPWAVDVETLDSCGAQAVTIDAMMRRCGGKRIVAG